jgi:hypothetical protein
MNADLVTIGSNPASLATTDAVGSSIFRQSRFFRLKPMKISLTQAQSRREGAIAGKFYNDMTGDHFDGMRVVMLLDPREARTKYVKGAPYGASPECFSTDGKVPHENAQSPQSLRCSTCRHADWSAWKKNKIGANVPQCKNRFVMYLVDRDVQIPYELEVKGQSITAFFSQMQHIGALAEKYRSIHKVYPELFYFSFKIDVATKLSTEGKNYIMTFSETRLMDEEARAEFGALLAEFEAYKGRQLRDESDKAEDTAIDGELSEAGSTGSTEFNASELQGEVTI